MDHYKSGQKFWDSLSKKKCKAEGIYYTSSDIVNFMIDITFDAIIRNKIYKKEGLINLKILDIASGSGFFYFELIDRFLNFRKNELEEFGDNILRVSKSIDSHLSYGEELSIEDTLIKIKDSVFAIEKDRESVDFSRDLFSKKYEEFVNISKGPFSHNIIEGDALFYRDRDIFESKFDILIGNPPYVGSKEISNDYSKLLREKYADVYKNKSDIYYCFFKAAVELLKVGGICTYIVPRYFFESESGKYLRKYLRKHIKIISIVDLRDPDAFSSNVGTSSCIITFEKISDSLEDDEFSDILIEILSISNLDGRIKRERGFLMISEDNWCILNEQEMEISTKLSQKEHYRLGDIVDFHQGIITGCDSAFIFESSSEVIKKLNADVKKSWIKSKNIKKYGVENSNLVLVYSNDLHEDEIEEKYLENLEAYKERLLNRREVRIGARRWFDLQWGRNKEVFCKRKIIFPFKSKDNRFALDVDNVYFSADVYSMTIKEEFEGRISYEYILGLLNSEVYEIYLRSFLKKMGKGIVEYYPYSLNRACIFLDENYGEIEKLSKKILSSSDENEKKHFQEQLDVLVFSCL
ncbi:Eco57I restriction-modification methylase domain-containing protein [Peptostreptococcus porci]|uniref:Eco57I restriction-modification methylase domain-containing protein n=1 Tax=Peptostreptococcus porci TaxID=2652282 RepID=UPI002A74C9D6|nr:TaqI-like C-terminal specificity domain-containing protein [Peptostreptococcus porci]MDY2795311.1 TaqI-like C-terminal specificity domain-containing protein [Peptostreptococcus porci]